MRHSACFSGGWWLTYMPCWPLAACVSSLQQRTPPAGCPPCAPSGVIVTCATRFSMRATTSSCAASRKVPVEVRVSDSSNSPLSLFTTSEAAILGLAWGVGGGSGASDGGSRAERRLRPSGGGRQLHPALGLAVPRCHLRQRPQRPTHQRDDVVALVIAEKVLVEERARPPRQVHHLAAPLLLWHNPVHAAAAAGGQPREQHWLQGTDEGLPGTACCLLLLLLPARSACGARGGLGHPGRLAHCAARVCGRAARRRHACPRLRPACSP